MDEHKLSIFENTLTEMVDLAIAEGVDKTKINVILEQMIQYVDSQD